MVELEIQEKKDLKQCGEDGARDVMDSRNKAILCAQEALEYKALDLVVLDVSCLSSFADYFVICSGKSSRQVQGISDHLEDVLRRHTNPSLWEWKGGRRESGF
jgi:ribosomal silencing factor RsfS